MKKIAMMFLSFVLTAAVFAGGGQQGGAAGGTARVGAKGSLPLATTKPKLSMVMTVGGPKVSSHAYADNVFTRRVVDETGIQLEITDILQGSNETLNAMIAAGNYPDILFGVPSIDDYAAQGIIIPLDQYDPLSYPRIKEAFDEFPAADEIGRGADGKMYGLPYVNQCLHCVHNKGRIWYYMPWIRDNNRKVPTTLDEFRDYLRWVRDTDVNKNGDPNDEIPLMWFNGYSWLDSTYNIVAFIAKSYMPFVWTSSYFGLALDDSRKIVEQYRDPRYRQALAYLAGLYAEGLIIEDAFTLGEDQARQLGQSTPNRIAVNADGVKGLVQPQNSARHIETLQLRTLVGPSGDHWAGTDDPYSIMWSNYFITDKCKDPELAIALYDYLIRKDIQLDAGHAPKGIGWDDPLPGTVAINGRAPTYRMLIPVNSQPLNSGWGTPSPFFRTTEFNYTGLPAIGVEEAKRWHTTGDPSVLDFLMNTPDYIEMFWYMTAIEDVPNDIPLKMFLPPLHVGSVDSERLADLSVPITTYVKQALTEFVIGTRNINSNTDWNAYLAELDRLGSKDMLNIMQKYVR